MFSRRQTIRFAVLLGVVLTVGRMVSGFIVTTTPPTEPPLLPSEVTQPEESRGSAWYFNTHSARRRTQYLGQSSDEAVTDSAKLD